MKQWLQNRLIHLITHHLFNAVTLEDILRQKGTDVYFQGRALNQETVLKLKEDAKNFKESFLWKIVLQDAKYQANVKMYEKSVHIADIVFAKAMLYAVDVIERKVSNLTY